MKIVIFTGDYRKIRFSFRGTPENSDKYKGIVEALADFYHQVFSKGSELKRESDIH